MEQRRVFLLWAGSHPHIEQFHLPAFPTGLKEGIFTIGAVLTLKENCGAGL